MYRIRCQIFILLLLLSFHPVTRAQFPSFTYNHLTTSQGLSDGVVRAIGQDKYGYIWVGTVSGLNRFDGNNVKFFQFDPRIPGSAPPSVARAIYNDSHGQLWIGFNNGLYRFDFAGEKFLPVSGTQDLSITRIIEDSSTSQLLLLTNGGVARLTTGLQKIEWITRAAATDIALFKKRLYIATPAEILQYNLMTGQPPGAPSVVVSDAYMNKIAVDRQERIWIGYSHSSRIIRMVHLASKTSSTYSLTSSKGLDTVNNKTRELFVDRHGRIWIMHTSLGLSLYNSKKNAFESFEYVISKPNSLSPYLSYGIFQSRDGNIWLGTEGYGVDYFNPDKTLFHVISPLEDRNIPYNSLWARSATEDKEGNLWLSWAGGICKYDPGKNKYTGFDNYYSGKKMLHNNSVRSLLCDDENNIWIGTGTGMNRYDQSNEQMQFLTIHDSLPETEFYWAMKQDARNYIWFGTGTNLYYRDPANKKIYSYLSHPHLKNVIDTGVRVIYQDHLQRLWFGMNGTGLVLYNPVSGICKKWKQGPGAGNLFLGNTITAIHQEDNGIMWFSTFNGLMSYDEGKDSLSVFTHSDALPSPKCSGILTDAANRLWIGTTAGLALFDPERKNFTSFTMSDGLPTLEFSDMPATRLNSGEFIFPTIRGFVRFNPMDHPTRQDTLEHYISAISISGSKNARFRNTEEMSRLDLKYYENFFSIQLVALNYSNPVRTWFAYKMEGFDNDWIVSPSGTINYTNVPGGNYSFRYKTSNDPNNWNVPEKILEIRIGTVYYKTLWFKLSMIVLIALLMYMFYQFRLNQQKKIFTLQSKAQLLEKEKALVRFEGLKQQLNPHFLFNSLSSLSSLIRTNNEMAISFLDKLSRIFRYILQSRDLDLITLEKELQFARSYISLQETRFQDGLQIKIDIPPATLSKKVVPVILQNLIDNAIKHNTIDSDNPLELNIYVEGDYLVVRNNLQRKNLVETSNQQGLQNLKSLYRYLTDRPMTTEETTQHFTVKIPLV